MRRARHHLLVVLLLELVQNGEGLLDLAVESVGSVKQLQKLVVVHLE